jgi:predicted nucleic acid-binding Zn ribbon protein
MRKSNTQPIGDVLKEYLKALKINSKLKEMHVVNHWEDLMGKSVANRTRSVFIKNKTLFVQLKSSVLRNELTMMRQSIMDKLNEQAGEKIIDKIVIK